MLFISTWHSNVLCPFTAMYSLSSNLSCAYYNVTAVCSLSLDHKGLITTLVLCVRH
jgi:hypothetical protein